MVRNPSTESIHPTQVRRGPKSGPETRERLLRVAEELFAQEGLDAVSLRKIMDAAKVGVSQLNYHFGTKRDLIRAIFESKLAGLSAERLGMLEDAEKEDPPSVERIVEAYFLPTFRTFVDPSMGNFVRLVARVGADSSELAKEMASEFLDGVQRRFAEALKRSMPQLSEREIYWRIHLMLCVAIQTHVNPSRIFSLSRGICDPGDADAMFAALQPLISSALRAPAQSSQTATPAKRKRR
jgi:AcrR family transcriptional regulator